MKQITFSNVVAVVAILLCFYAFAGEKDSSADEEMEYCIMRVYPSVYSKTEFGTNIIFPDGTFKHDITPVENDPTQMKMANVKMKELISVGWKLKSNSITGSGVHNYVVAEYIFERPKQ